MYEKVQPSFEESQDTQGKQILIFPHIKKQTNEKNMDLLKVQTDLNFLVHWLAVYRPYWINLVPFSYITVVAVRYFRQCDVVAKFSLSYEPFSWFQGSVPWWLEKGKYSAQLQENWRDDVDILEWVQRRAKMTIWSTGCPRRGWKQWFVQLWGGSTEMLLLSTNIWEEATDRVKPNFSQRCTMVGQEAS